MIGTTTATVLFALYIFLAAVLGTATGGLTTLALHRRWRLKDALTDAILAALGGLATAYIAAATEAARGVWASNVTLVLCAAVAVVVLKHLIAARQRNPKPEN